MQYVNLRPSQVILDPENPRLPDGTSNDREAINRLLDDGADAILSLARHIARTGQTNPADLPMAMKAGNKYLILEGNRRFAALKLLKDPRLAQDDDLQKAFQRAAALGTPPKTVFTVVLSSREAADPWIVLRHTGENNGVGIKRWNAEQTARHRRRAQKPIDSGTLRAITIADELEEAYAADEEVVGLVREARRDKLTNIGRFFSPDVLSALHFTLRVDESSSLGTRYLLVRHSSEQLRDFFAWALTYIIENSVDAYKNAAIRQGVLRDAADLLPNFADAAAEPFRLVDNPPDDDGDSNPASAGGDEEDSSSGTDDGSTGSSGQQSDTSAGTSDAADDDQSGKQSSKSEAKPEKCLFERLRLPKHSSRIQRLLKECRSLELAESPGIACVMTRVIVELSVSSAEALALSGATDNTPLGEKIKAMLMYLDPQIEIPRRRDGRLAQAYLEASELGIQYLNGFVHNPEIYPDQHLARRFSTAFRPLLVRVDEAL